MTDNNIDLPIYVDDKKTLVVKIKDYTITLEELRELLGNGIPDSYAFYGEFCIQSEEEEVMKVKEILIDNSVHFHSQERIIKDETGNDEISVKGGSSNLDISSLTLGANNTTTTPDSTKTTTDSTKTTTDSTTTDTANTGDEKKKLMNFNVVDNQDKIIEYCKSLPLKFAVDSETFKTTSQIVEWDLNSALIYPSQESSVSYLSKSTFNSIEHNAHKSGLFSWKAGASFKTISANHDGSVETDNTKNSTSSTAYSYTHGLVARFVINVGNQKIKINDETINRLKAVSGNLDLLKALLKTIEYFPTQFTFGGKIATTAFKDNCTESDKDSFALKLQTDFKASLLNSNALNLEAGSTIDKKSNNDNNSKSDYSLEERIVCGGDSASKSFDEFIFSLDSYKNCNIIEINNVQSIWEILSMQEPELYKKCQDTLGIDNKRFDIVVGSNVGSKSYSKFSINGRDILVGNNKGFNVVLLDSNYSRIDSKNFDTCSKIIELFVNRSYKFGRYLEKVEKGNVILISVNDDAFNGLGKYGREALEKIGIQRVDYFTSNSSFCAIIKKEFNTVQDSADKGPCECKCTYFLN